MTTLDVAILQDERTPEQAGQSKRVRFRFFRNIKVAIGAIILLLFAALAIVGPLFINADPTAFVDLKNLPPSAQHLLGTSGQGQEILTQIVYGARNSLGIGVLVGLLATTVGATVGLSSAYFGGWVDEVLSLTTNVFVILPGLPLLVALAAFLPPGPLTMIGVLSVTGWAWTARVIRSQALSIRQRDYIAAAVVTGEGPGRLMIREIAPNMLSILVGALVGSITYGIAAQAGLEFLGLGDLSSVSWGTILYWAGNNASLLLGTWWTFLPAGLCIALVGFGLTLLNFGADEITNPRLLTSKGGPDGTGSKFLKATGITPVRRTTRPVDS